MDAAFEIVAPALRKIAQAEGVRLQEFLNEDPIWRLAGAGGAGVDVVWDEVRPDSYSVRAHWYLGGDEPTGGRRQEREVGDFRRDQPLEELEALLRLGLEAVLPPHPTSPARGEELGER